MRRSWRSRSTRAETCTMIPPAKAVSEAINSAQRLWFRGGIASIPFNAGAGEMVRAIAGFAATSPKMERAPAAGQEAEARRGKAETG